MLYANRLLAELIDIYKWGPAEAPFKVMDNTYEQLHKLEKGQEGSADKVSDAVGDKFEDLKRLWDENRSVSLIPPARSKGTEDDLLNNMPIFDDPFARPNSRPDAKPAVVNSEKCSFR